MLIKILDKATLGNDLDFSVLEKYGNIEIYDCTDDTEIYSRIQDVEIIIINKIKINEEVLKYANKLKLICVFATGYDNIDIGAARNKGIAVCNVPAYSTESVALLTVTCVLNLWTHLNEYSDFVSSGRYTADGMANRLTPVYHEIKGKTWGIVGFGNIGKRVAEIATVLGANVIVNKRVKTDGCRCVDLDTLCKESDIITLHCPLNEQTYHLINSGKIEMMKSNVVLVNEARGNVTDETAVAEAVLNGKIGAFGSDVYSHEPFAQDHPFNQIKHLENVCLTPHCAWAAYESRVRALEIVCENISSFISGKNQNRVDK